MTRATKALRLVFALALGAALIGCESDGDAAKPGTSSRSFWDVFSAPEPSGAAQSDERGAGADAKPPAPIAKPPSTVADSPPPANDPSPTVASLPPPAASPNPAVLLRRDPMVLKKALQDGEAVPLSLPREVMAKLFRTLEAFQPTAEQVKIIEAYGRQLAGAEQARLRYELETCQAAPSCVVVPQR